MPVRCRSPSRCFPVDFALVEPSLGFGLLGYEYLNVITVDANVKRVGRDSGVFAPSPVREFEVPGVPRTHDGAVLDETAGQRGPHVRAKIINGLVDIVNKKHCDHASVYFIRAALAGWNVAHFGDRFECGHEIVLTAQS